MRSLPCFVLVLLLGLTACARSADTGEPRPRPEVARLLEIAAGAEVELDPADAPVPREGFSRADVRRLATALVDAVERTGTTDAEKAVTERDAADHTFATLDMRSRVRIAELLESTSRDYDDMPVTWVISDRWESGHRPVRPGRVIRAAWDTTVEQGHLEVSLQVLQAYVTTGGDPMFIDRTFALFSPEPARWPAVPFSFGAKARVFAIDRCHIVETGRLRHENRPESLRKAAESLDHHLGTKGVRESARSDFRRGCD